MRYATQCRISSSWKTDQYSYFRLLLGGRESGIEGYVASTIPPRGFVRRDDSDSFDGLRVKGVSSLSPEQNDNQRNETKRDGTKLCETIARTVGCIGGRALVVYPTNMRLGLKES